MKAKSEAKIAIERMFQRAMNLRDSMRQSVDFEPIEREYVAQYRRAYRTTRDAMFAQHTREYRTLLRAYRHTEVELRKEQAEKKCPRLT